MHPEMKEWFEQRAIAQVRALVDGQRSAAGESAFIPDGHLLRPPVYPAYQSNSFEASSDYQGLWVRWFQKESQDSPWEHCRRLIRYADLE
jgi:hypothetical protein